MPKIAERMEMPISDETPVAKFDPELEGALRLTKKIRFVDSGQEIIFEKRRRRSFTDSDDAYVFRFYQPDARAA